MPEIILRLEEGEGDGGRQRAIHEPVESLGSETMERHRAIVSPIEELESIDWYQQRIDAVAMKS